MLNCENIGNIIDFTREVELRKYMWVNEGEAFVDVGAHIGLWTTYVGRHGERVYAFEPNPITFKILQGNIKRYPNIISWQVALGDEEGVQELYLHNRSCLDGLRVMTTEYTGRKVTVEVYRLDSLNSLESIGLIKIDTEGYEEQVLRGAKEIIKRDKPRIIIEVHRGLRPLQEEVRILTNILYKYKYHYKSIYKPETGQPILITE